jgi:hypothetical protein
MTPFDHDEELLKLLGEARPVEAKGNFLPNVMRAIRLEPQDRGVWAAVRAWWAESQKAWALPLGAAAAALVVLLNAPTAPEAVPSTLVVQARAEAVVLAEEPVSALVHLDEVDALLAMEDTSSLSDQELSFLLY